MNKTREKLAPKYKEACLKLGELEFQRHVLSLQLTGLNQQIESIYNSLKGMEALFPVVEEFEKELTTKPEPKAD